MVGNESKSLRVSYDELVIEGGDGEAVWVSESDWDWERVATQIFEIERMR